MVPEVGSASNDHETGQKRTHQLVEDDSSTDDDSCDNGLSYYERVRMECIEERTQLLKSLGLFNENAAPADPYKPKTKPIKKPKPKQAPPTPRAPTRKSLRLEQRQEGYTEVKTEVKSEENGEDSDGEVTDNRTLGSINLKEEVDWFPDQQFIDKLKEISSDIYTSGRKLDLATLSIQELQAVLFSLKLSDYPRILNKRIQSLAIHPSPHLLVFAGAVDGSIAIWDSDGGEDAVKFNYHKAPVNCLSVCRYNKNNIFSTSHDGTFGTLDINSLSYSNLFATDLFDRTRHLTWHEQVDANNFLLCHGNGSVGAIDVRTKKDNISWIKCFHRSARTVQLHPKVENYFLVSSGTGEASIFDLRKKSCVTNVEEASGLTSSFFSPDGTKMLSTCNDNTLKIYSLCNTKWIIEEMKSITHNNHTGRWLSVFKANWLPGRSDVFHVGSLLDPRRLQFFNIDGINITELKDENMTTIQPVIAVHTTEPIIVGGNSSGRLHVFRPPVTVE